MSLKTRVTIAILLVPFCSATFVCCYTEEEQQPGGEREENLSDLDSDDLAPPPAGNTEGDSLKLSKDEIRAAKGILLVHNAFNVLKSSFRYAITVREEWVWISVRDNVKSVGTLITFRHHLKTRLFLFAYRP